MSAAAGIHSSYPPSSAPYPGEAVNTFLLLTLVDLFLLALVELLLLLLTLVELLLLLLTLVELLNLLRSTLLIIGASGLLLSDCTWRFWTCRDPVGVPYYRPRVRGHREPSSCRGRCSRGSRHSGWAPAPPVSSRGASIPPRDPSHCTCWTCSNTD